MITEIRMAYRHLREVELRDLKGVNIIVGPNNAGKTSIFRGIKAMTSRRMDSDDDVLSIGTRIEFPEQVLRKIDDSNLKNVLSWRTDEEFSLVQWSRFDKDHKGSGHIGTMSPSLSSPAFVFSERKVQLLTVNEHLNPKYGAAATRTGPSPLTAGEVATTVNTIDRQQLSWREDLYFLWHRRKSRYEEELGTFHGRLDDEAEHVAGRLDHLLTGTRGGALRNKLNRFMDAVIPGIGDIGIRRRQAEPDGKTLISVVFSNGREDRTLGELGGGVEQTLVLALVLLGEKDEGAVFIEEPESHLHESAQRRLIEQVVQHRGARQVFIATHSPVFVNEFPDANVYRITRGPDGVATVHACVDRASQREVLNGLGVLPSSLTQTNCVLWVEGPTETRLVRHWLTLVAPDLKVHQHYEFAETGGSNLASLAADLPGSAEGEHLRDIMRVCRNNFMICDRDAGIDKQPSKQPVKAIEALVGHHHWITRGYEIEWYIPPAVIAAVWDQAASDHVAACAAADEPFYKCLAASTGQNTKSAGKHKVLWAERVVSHGPDAATWFADPMGEDLRTNIERVAAFIREANQMTPPPIATCGECGQAR